MSVKEGAISFDDDSVKNSNKDFKDDPIKRIVFTAVNEVKRIVFYDDSVVVRLRHYKKGKGYRRCLAYQGFCPACASGSVPTATKDDKKFARASESFGTNVFVYTPDPNDPAEPIKPIHGFNHLFIFGAEKFLALKKIKKMYGSLKGLDLELTCTDKDFQKMNIINYPRESSYASQPEVAAYIDKVKEAGVYPVEKLIAKEVTPAQMIADFGLDPSLVENEVKPPIQDLAKPKDPVQPVIEKPKQQVPAEVQKETAPVAPAKENSMNKLLDEL